MDRSKTNANWLRILDKIKHKYEEQRNAESPKYSADYKFISFKGTKEPYYSLIRAFQAELQNILPGNSELEISNMIPSIHLFAKMFGAGYIPKDSMLDACYYYATGKSKTTYEKENPTLALIVPKSVSQVQSLTIHYPTSGSEAPRFLIIKGKAEGANLVWPVVRAKLTDRPIGGARYWVQPEAYVQPDGNWEVQIYIGGQGNGDVGSHFEVRAFMNPIELLTEGDILRAWPEAQLASEIIEVVRI